MQGPASEEMIEDLKGASMVSHSRFLSKQFFEKRMGNDPAFAEEIKRIIREKIDTTLQNPLLTKKQVPAVTRGWQKLLTKIEAADEGQRQTAQSHFI